MGISISSPSNIWYDAQSVDDLNLNLEQSHNEQLHSSIVGNHIGTGVLPESLLQHVIWDSSLSNDLLDGKNILTQSQPTDSSNGNQLEIELSGSLVAGIKTVKIIVIGLDFQNALQYDTFTFAKNEKQISSKHYKLVLSLFINDFYGSALQSFNLGGRLVIREASPMSISRDPIMIAQNVEPNLVMRDFFVASGGSLSNLLSTSLPSYNIDTLNIKTGYKQLRSLVENDVSSQLGQKFLSRSDNVQKISLLLSVSNAITPTNLVWTGDIIVSLYALQSTVQSSTDIVPNLAIDYDPTNIPLAQLSFNYDTLYAAGIELDGYAPQPVDFIFSNTNVGSGLTIKPDYYYAITVKRAGTADVCQIQLATGSNTAADTRETIFNGSVWIDIPDESIWFIVNYDSVKISDGQAYDNGNGIQITKTIIDSTTGSTIDYSFNNNSFLRNDVYNAVLQSITTESAPIQNERTGNLINSEKELKPSLSLLNTLALADIQAVSEPLIIGTVVDQNIKTTISNVPLTASFHHFGIVGNEIVFKVIDDITDSRYDSDLVTLVADIISGKINYGKLIPNIASPLLNYRISKAEVHDLVYGDIGGDGFIDAADLLEVQSLLGLDLNTFPTAQEYSSHTSSFVSDVSMSWEIVDSLGASLGSPITGTDGILTADGMAASFVSATANFITNIISGRKLKIVSSTTTSNIGTYRITELPSNLNVNIVKLEYTSDLFLKALKADIDGYMSITATDSEYIGNYVSLTPPFPSPTLPASKIGTSFRAVRLTLEKFVDRADNYPGSSANRSTTLHASPDIFTDGIANWSAQNVLSIPISFSITKQLNWREDNILLSSTPAKMVLASFNEQNGYSVNSEDPTNLNVSTTYPTNPAFDPGKNNVYIHNDLILNPGSQLVNVDGSYHKLDFEVGTISFEIPADVVFSTEKIVNTLTDFIADYNGNGYTRIGYPCMRFADNSYVSMSGFIDNQIRISAGIISHSPGIDGYAADSIGVAIDHTSGVLTLKFANLYKDPILQTRATRIQIVVYLKRAGWINSPIIIDSSKTVNLLEL